MSALLRVEQVNKSFGALTVADNVSFSLPLGEALGVIGPNGAGKTTMFNLITGTLAADSGSIWFADEDVTGRDAAHRCRAGMARSFQVPQPFGGLTVFENTMVAATQATGLRGAAAEQLCLDVLDQTGLLHSANTLSSTLTLLDRKREAAPAIAG